MGVSKHEMDTGKRYAYIDSRYVADIIRGGYYLGTVDRQVPTQDDEIHEEPHHAFSNKHPTRRADHPHNDFIPVRCIRKLFDIIEIIPDQKVF